MVRDGLLSQEEHKRKNGFKTGQGLYPIDEAVLSVGSFRPIDEAVLSVGSFRRPGATTYDSMLEAQNPPLHEPNPQGWGTRD